MAGPVGGAGGAEEKIEEGTFSDTPITVVGTPRGLSDKERPCDETGFTLCFSDVTISDAGPEEGTGRRQYRIEGCLLKKVEASGLFFDMVRHRILIEDLLFPELELSSASTGKTDCWIQQPTVIAGRPSAAPRVRLQANYCKRTTTLDLPLPDAKESPMTFDPCSSTGPTDVYTGDPTEIRQDPAPKTLQPSFPNRPDTPQPPTEPDPQGPRDPREFLPGYPQRTRQELDHP
jgi:hypothetical protein